MANKEMGVSAAFAQKVLFIVLVVVLGFLAVKLVTLWLLIFASIVMAVILRTIAEPILKYTPFHDSFGVIIALILLSGVLTGLFILFGNAIVAEAHNLSERVPAAWDLLQTQLKTTLAGRTIIEQLSQMDENAGSFFSSAPALFQGVASAIANFLVVVVGGIFMAMKPEFYRDGLVLLFPKDQQDTARFALNTSGKALRNWVIGQSVGMVLVGSLVTIGLSIIGVPSPIALGMISGLAQFVPLVGPVIATTPGLILAASTGWQALIWAILIYVGVSQFESILITPYVQHHMTSMPPVLILFAVMGFALLLGPLGVILATPLAVVIFTLIKTLYVEKNVGLTSID